MTTTTFRIQGMTCNHCVMSVRRALASVEGAEVEDVQIGSAVVSFDESKLQEKDIDAAIEGAGYTVSAHE